MGLSLLSGLNSPTKLLVMKKLILLIIVSLVLLPGAEAQLIKRLGDRAKQKMEQKAGEKVDKSIDDAVDGKKKKTTKKKSNEEDVEEEEEVTEEDENTAGEESSSEKKSTKPKAEAVSIANYGKYDFVPGSMIMFEDNLANEASGEFPSLFSTTKGQAQVIEVNGEKVIQAFGCTNLIPRFKESETGKDVLPDQFTIEFDAYFAKEWASTGWWWVELFFFDESDPNHWEYQKEVPKYVWMDQKTAKYEGFTSEVPEDLMKGGWNHVAIAVNKNMLKVYVNQTRLINTPNFKGNPKAITLEMRPNGCDEKAVVMIKNFRMAQGGMDMYKTATMEGKFIARGITFDYNKATLKPESMGELNKIVKFLGDNPTMKFEIGGHTDTDGEDDYNLKLSQQRADAVKTQLVKMGVDESRLTTKGYGETKPISDNGTPEGKANNRRVEFVKS
jgi:OmpA-OmpF porin, OOP family